jgi:hypothetical protein
MRRTMTVAPQSGTASSLSCVQHYGSVVHMRKALCCTLRCMEKAPGAPGRWELRCIRSTGGLAIHLWDTATKEACCKGLRSGKIVIGSSLPSFEDLGCIRCARAAAKHGYTFVLNHVGERIELDGFTPYF